MRRISLRDLLLVVQIAICAVLVTSSLVAVRGLMLAMHSNFGFDPRNVMLADTNLSMAGYSGDQCARDAKAHDRGCESNSRREVCGPGELYPPGWREHRPQTSSPTKPLTLGRRMLLPVTR